ncbi:MAG: hypothetical protein IKN06_01950 [Bacteroidales bacterium]|nr:hypothetical protein [Bacteroidales bacterium]
MKTIYRILLAAILVMLAGFEAAAQYTVQAPHPVTAERVVITDGKMAGTYSDMPLEVHSADLYYYSHPGTPLTVEQLRDILTDTEFATYKRAHGLLKTAELIDKATIITAVVSAGGAAGYSLFCWVTGYPAAKEVFYGFGVCFGVSVTLATVNIPIKTSGFGKVKKIAREHNRAIRLEPNLSFGITGNGAGVALNF